VTKAIGDVRKSIQS